MARNEVTYVGYNPLKIAFNSLHPSTSQQATSENEDELVKVKQVLYLLNKFSISDQFNHEMTFSSTTEG